MCWYDTAEERKDGKYVNATTVHLTLVHLAVQILLEVSRPFSVKGTGAVIAAQDTDCGYS